MIDLDKLKDDSGFMPGVYFGLPEADYHADKALGGGDVKRLLAGPMDYQASSWMNPAYKPPQSRSMRFGSADHKCILEGETAFRAEYFKPVEPAFLDAITDAGSAEIVCQALHIQLPATVAEVANFGGPKKAAANMMRKQVETAYKKSCDRKERLSVAEFNRILWLAHAIKGSPYKRLFEPIGFPEVSVFWRLQNGIPCKCRIDRLSVEGALQWKTFSNSYGIAPEECVNRQFIKNNHHVECAHYVEGMEAAQTLMAQTRITDCRSDANGNTDIVIGPDIMEFCIDFHKITKPQYLMAYRDSGIAPNIVTRTYDYVGNHEYVRRARQKRNQALRVYHDCMEQLGPLKPWYPEPNVKRFDDADFSVTDLES